MPKLSLQAVAEHLGLSRQAASHHLRALGLTLDHGLDQIRLAYLEHLRQQAAMTASPARERLLRLKTLREEIRLKIDEGRTIDLAVAEEHYGSFVDAAVQRLLRVPTRVLDQFPNLPSVYTLVEAEIAGALSELSGRATTDV
jgi:DNA-binding transcriptional ArsR family regulator